MTHFRHTAIVPLLLVGLVACSAPPQSEDPVSQPADPADRFTGLEMRLLEAADVGFDFEVQAEGAVSANLSGRMDISGSGNVSLVASGVFAGREVELGLSSVGEEYAHWSGETRFEGTPPQDLVEALVIGVTRMGILHNLAVMSSGAGPDHAEGGVKDWVTVGGFSEDANGGIAFDLTVAGQPSGSAVVETDEVGRLVTRRQTVHFPGGEMRVVERYSNMLIR